jgi:hypothetical protein
MRGSSDGPWAREMTDNVPDTFCRDDEEEQADDDDAALVSRRVTVTVVRALGVGGTMGTGPLGVDVSKLSSADRDGRV